MLRSLSSLRIDNLVTTWNAAGTTFTALKLNVTDTASAAGSLLMDLQVGGVSKISGTKAGALRVADGTSAAPSYAFDSDTDTGFFSSGAGQIGGSIDGTQRFRWTTNDFRIESDSGALYFGAAGDIIIARDAANTLAQRNGTNAQSFRIYNTFTDASNYERLESVWASNIVSFRTAQAGTGTARAFRLGAGGTDRWDIGATSGNFVGITATSGLGYGTGAGGTVTQLTNKSTGVTLNTITGIVTMNGASLAADTTVSFVLTDSAIAATDAVIIIHESVGTLGAYSFASTAAAGSVTIAVHNNTPGALAEAIVLRFVVIKSVNA